MLASAVTLPTILAVMEDLPPASPLASEAGGAGCSLSLPPPPPIPLSLPPFSPPLLQICIACVATRGLAGCMSLPAERVCACVCACVHTHISTQAHTHAHTHTRTHTHTHTHVCQHQHAPRHEPLCSVDTCSRPFPAQPPARGSAPYTRVSQRPTKTKTKATKTKTKTQENQKHRENKTVSSTNACI